MTRPFRLACVLICLASMGLTISGAAERMLQAEVPGEEMSTSTIASHEALRLRIRQLAAELGSTAEPRPVAERLRAAAAAYLMGLEKEQGSGASGSLEGQRSAQPIPPRTVERGEGLASPTTQDKLQERQESLSGTHLAPSPEEMRARARPGEESPREPLVELLRLLGELDRLFSTQPAADPGAVSRVTSAIQEIAARIAPTR
jgi:hypothetical protein